jgi:hypothetical protein
MSLSNSKIVPAAFWVGFLALGFIISLGGPNRRHAESVTQPSNPIAAQAIDAEIVKKTETRNRALLVRN